MNKEIQTLIKSTLISLSSQGFFCIAVRKAFIGKNYREIKNIPFFGKERVGIVPSITESKEKLTTPEEWREIFELENFDTDVDRLAVFGGLNGVAAFDFDSKKFEEDTGEMAEAREVWSLFCKYASERTNGEIYRETTPSGGEHLIFLIHSEGSRDILFSNSKLAVMDSSGGRASGSAFVETMGYGLKKSRGCGAKQINIYPGNGYKKIGTNNIWELKRFSKEVYADCIGFWEGYKHKHEIRNDDGTTAIDVFKKINNENNVIDILTDLGYTLVGTDRMLAPNSTTGQPGVQIFDSKRFVSYHGGCVFNDGRAHDALDAICVRDGKSKSDIVGEFFSPESNRNKETMQIYNKIEVNDEQIVVNIYRDDEEESVFEVVTERGKRATISTKQLMSNTYLDNFGAIHYPSSYSMTSSFKKLRATILGSVREFNEKAKTKTLMKKATRIDGKFIFQDTDTIFIEQKYVKPVGNFKSWYKGVALPCHDYPGSIFTLILAFAAPLVSVLHKSFAINLVGDSNIGKTFSCAVARSVKEDCDVINASWTSTTSAIQATLEEYDNALLCMDELSGANAETLGLVMTLCGATTRFRARWDKFGMGTEKRDRTGNVILSCSEMTFKECTKRHGVTITSGTLNRMIDINVLASDFACERGRAREIITCAKANYGSPIVEFLNRLDSEEKLAYEFEDYSRENIDLTLPDPMQRVLGHFVFLKFVAIQLQELKILSGNPVEAVEEFEKRYFSEDHSVLDKPDSSIRHDMFEYILELYGSTKYISPNDPRSRPGEYTCFISDPIIDSYSPSDDNAIYILPGPFYKLITNKLPIGKHKAKKILESEDIIRSRTQLLLKYTGSRENVYRIDINKIDSILNG